jgi:Zn-dependent peptidase ImmA (M78 family)/transcriptional regulator with XRE-family HTH domain
VSLADQLARAREAIGYPQEDVANALGVTRTMVSYWESGRRRPNERQLAALARLYGVEVRELLLGPSRSPWADLTRMMLRGEPDLGPEARRGLREFVRFLDTYAELAEAVGFPVRGMRQSPFTLAPGFDSREDARRKAEEVRAHLRLGIGPVGDLDAVCELLGVTVFRTALGAEAETGVSGAFLKHPAVGFSVVVNLQMTPGRRRFTLAHELAHALFHSDRHTHVISGPSRNGLERFANAFAGEFLMPAEGIRRAMEEYGIGPQIDDPADVVHLQRFFCVSYATALVRLRQARMISAQAFEAFQQVRPVLFAERLGYEPSDEEYGQDVERWRTRRFPGKFLTVLRLALSREVISVPTAAGITGLTIDEIEELAMAAQPADDETRRELAGFATARVVDG